MAIFIPSLGLVLGAEPIQVDVTTAKTTKELVTLIETARLNNPGLPLEIVFGKQTIALDADTTLASISLDNGILRGVKEGDTIQTIIQGSGTPESRKPLFGLSDTLATSVSNIHFDSIVSSSGSSGILFNLSGKKALSLDNTLFTGNGIRISEPVITSITGGLINQGVYNGTQKLKISNSQFRNNVIDISVTNGSIRGGVVASSNASGLVETTINNVVFDGNKVKVRQTAATGYAVDGGALSSSATGIENSTFTNNSIFVVGTEAISENTLGRVVGGALALYDDVRRPVNQRPYVKNTDFRGNSAVLVFNYQEQTMNGGAYGGAVYGGGFYTDCSFYDNYAGGSAFIQSGGGAIYATEMDTYSGYVSLEVSAVNKDVVFSGNRAGVIVDAEGNIQAGSGYANAITVTPRSPFMATARTDSTLSLSAKTGKSVTLYDTIVFAACQDMGSFKATLKFNENSADTTTDFGGTVVFSGEKYKNSGNVDDVTSRVSSRADMVQYKGTLVIKEGAILGAVDKEELTWGVVPAGTKIGAKSFTMKQGTLEMITQGHLMATTVILTQRASEGSVINDAGDYTNTTLRIGSGSQLTAQSVTVTGGITLDIKPFLADHDSGLIVNAGTIDMAGPLAIADEGFYNSSYWASQQAFLVFDLTNMNPDNIKGEFSDVISVATGNSRVEDGVVHKGTWSQRWEDFNNDGKNDKLYAVWTPDAVPEPASATLGLLGLAALLIRRRR